LSLRRALRAGGSKPRFPRGGSRGPPRRRQRRPSGWGGPHPRRRSPRPHHPGRTGIRLVRQRGGRTRQNP
jgi:hypothetical protein